MTKYRTSVRLDKDPSEDIDFASVPFPKPHPMMKWSLYVERLQEPMNLMDWRVEILDDPCEDDSYATVNCIYGQKKAELKLCEGFNDLSRDEQRSTFVHELTHCHLWVIQEMGEEDLAQFLSSGEKEMYSRSFRRAIEYAVDSLASAIAPHLPLPSDE